MAAAPALGDFEPGAPSLGDPILPQIGNGGYDALHYDIDLRYDPEENRLEPPTGSTMIATATQDLSRFSLDFQDDLTITSVSVDGVPASFDRKRARPRLGDNPDASQPYKLYITPQDGIEDGSRFTVVVDYSGKPKAIVDLDGSSEGWIRACSPAGCDGSFTLNEPWGAQSWFPSNNHPSDKATAVTRLTVPPTHTGLGVGELVSRTANWDGTVTWVWQESNPTATYLFTGTVGRFDVEQGSMRTALDGTTLPIFNVVDSAATATRKEAVAGSARAQPGIIDFISKRLGPYPFGSTGVVAGWVTDVGYALENQTKPHFPGEKDGPKVPRSLLSHELAHQWMGNSVSPRWWNVVWFNEGWATLTELQWSAARDSSQMTPGQFMRFVYASPASRWRVAPAILDRDPAYLFDDFVVYSRPAAMLEGLRRIIGNQRFFALARRIGAEHRYADITRKQFRRAAVVESGFAGKRANRLRRYLDQWLLWERKPRLSWKDFRQTARWSAS